MNRVAKVDSKGPSQDTAAPLAAKFVLSLLCRHGVPRHRRASVVAEVLGLSYSQVHRRFNRSATWALEELKLLAEHFGETLAELMTGEGAEPRTHPATLEVFGSIECRVILGKPSRSAREGTSVATATGPGWRVRFAEGAVPDGVLQIKRILIEPTATARRRIAVLDDHADTAMSIAAYLQGVGMEATPFTDRKMLSLAARTRNFDGYVLDWLIGAEPTQNTAHELIEEIRSEDSHCPILVLTGQMRNRSVDQDVIATAMTKHRVKIFEKPAPLAIVVAALSAPSMAPRAPA